MNFKPLGDFLDSLMDRGIPGADVAVMQNHELLYRHQAGWRNREKQIPLRGDELYFVYSCSKVITVTAAMQLYEQGRFLINDPLYEYLPEYRSMMVKDAEGHVTPAKNPILIKHLFCMTAGFDYNLNNPAILQARQKTNGLCPTREIIRALADAPLCSEPGEHYRYSLCHDVLAALVEVISGERFSDYVEKHIFDPVGMNRSTYHVVPGTENQFASKYLFDNDKRCAEPVALNAEYILGPEYDSGGAGIISCVEDYARFVDTMACDGISRTGEQILSPAAIDLMRANHLTASLLNDFDPKRIGGYGYGLGVRTMIDQAAGGALSPLGEFGWSGAAGSYVLIDPANRLSVFYAQHMLNPQNPYVHPRVRDITYSCFSRR